MMDLSPGSSWRQLINDEFNQDRYKDFRNWYFKKFKDFELKEFKEKYYDYLSEIQSYVPFVKWFVKYFHNKVKSEIMILQSKNWCTYNGEIITSPFPPEQTISLGKNVEATAYLNLQNQKVENDHITLRELNSIIKSQNYTNTFLICLGDQFMSLEKDISD